MTLSLNYSLTRVFVGQPQTMRGLQIMNKKNKKETVLGLRDISLKGINKASNLVPTVVLLPRDKDS